MRWCTARARCIGKMPGDEWQQFANLRLLFGYMWTHPGKKLLFMGGEFGQRREWQHEESLEWHVLQYPLHAGVQRWVRDLNRLYRATAGAARARLHRGRLPVDRLPRRRPERRRVLAPRRARETWRWWSATSRPCRATTTASACPQAGRWRERLNSDAADYGGGGQGNLGALDTQPQPAHAQPHSLQLHLPPLALVILTPG